MSWSAAQIRYSKSAKGRASRLKYQSSEKGKLSRQKYLAKRKAKLAEAKQEMVVTVNNEVKTTKIKSEAVSK